MAGYPLRDRPSLPLLKGARSALVAGVLAVALAGCSSSSPASAIRPPPPAGSVPSNIAIEVCAHEAQQDMKAALGLTATVTTKTWLNHKYSCAYDYPDGHFILSVKELSSRPQTLGYFHSLGRQLGVTRHLANLGQGAFQVTNGSVVVRKDSKVLLVDVTGLPARFGVPPTSSSDIAVTVADVILACWAGD